MSEKTPLLRRAWQSAMRTIGTAALSASGSMNSAELQKLIDLSYGSTAGPVVTPNSALTISTVFACVRNIADDISTLPVGIFRRLPNGDKVQIADHPAAKLLRKPNPWQTRTQFLRWFIGQRALHGNGLAVHNIVRGRVVELLPTQWGEVEVIVGPAREPLYRIQRPGASEIVLPRSQVTHLMGFSTDGYEGLSPIKVGRDAMGLTLAANRHASRVFKTGGTSRIAITNPKNFGRGEAGQKAAKSFRDSFVEAYGGENSSGVFVLEDDMKASVLSLSPEDLQFLQSREFQIEEVVRWWRMALHMVQHPKGLTNGSIEQQSLEHLIYTLRPIIVDAEQVLTQDLLGGAEDLFLEFNVNGLLRGNLKDRFDSYGIGRQWGWLSVNDIRRLESQNAIGPEGDRYLEPVNMAVAGAPAPVPVNDPARGK